MAMLGAASITGVPALGLPKISSLVGRICIPAFSASPLWSTSAKSATPLACRMLLSLSTVWSTEWLLSLAVTPLAVTSAKGVSSLDSNTCQPFHRSDDHREVFIAVRAELASVLGGSHLHGRGGRGHRDRQLHGR